jgi:hypothetical protein
MLARPYDPKDAAGLDLLLGNNRAGDVRLDEDQIFVVGEHRQPTGCLVFRPGAFVHQLECGIDFKARYRADVLANYAIATARAKGIRTAILLVKGTNVPMLRWARNFPGMIEQSDPGDVLFTLTPP